MYFLECSDSDYTLSKSWEKIKHETHPKVDYMNSVCVKPWGYEFLIFQNKLIGIWFLNITSGNRTSLHCHYNKDTKIIVLSGSMRLELINEEVMTINEMESVYIPREKFHSIGSFSPNTYIMEIEVYNDNVDFSDKNDLLRITDIYKRRDNKYDSSIDLSHELEKYGYFYLHSGFKHCFKDVEIDVGNMNMNADYNILLDGKIVVNETILAPGSFISNQNVKHLNDESLILTLKNKGSCMNHKIIYTEEQLRTVVKNLKNIVLTSGCFDIVHVGHIQHLIQAKNDGDVLMVCMSSDEQIKKIKGDTRPINTYLDRINLFKMIGCVDYIMMYNEVNNDTEETLGSIMRIVDPSLWVKGSDYTIEKIREKHPYLRNIKIYPNIPDRSTTSIIEKITNLKS